MTLSSQTLAERFTSFIADFPILLDCLLKARRVALSDHKTMPVQGGVYSVWNYSELLYVGQTNNIAGRMRAHLTSDLGKASLARYLLEDSLSSKGQSLRAHPDFSNEFQRVRSLVRSATIQFVQIQDCMKRIGFEFYATVCLAPRFHDFDRKLLK